MTWFCHRCGESGGIGPKRSRRPTRQPPVRQKQQPEAERYERLADWGQALWDACRPIDAGTIAAIYLEHRGCAPPPLDGDLKWHPEVRNRRENHIGPALVALVTDLQTGEPISLHRTWLAPDGSGKARPRQAAAPPRSAPERRRDQAVA